MKNWIIFRNDDDVVDVVVVVAFGMAFNAVERYKCA